MKFLVRSADAIFAVYETLTAAERYYMICQCYTNPSIYIAKEGN